MIFSRKHDKKLIRLGLFSFAALFASAPLAGELHASTVIERNAGLGIIKGIVRDESGKPISDAIVAIFEIGKNKVLKQVRSATDGSFLTKILPGKYTILAVAQGYNATTLSAVEVGRSTELVYGFNLERVGSGNTLPEKKVDRNSSKWIIRAAQNQRSIYQANEGVVPVAEKEANTQPDVEDTLAVADDEEIMRRGQSVVETYFSNSAQGNYAGLNFATLQPLSENTEIVIAGQTGTSKAAPQRLEATLKNRLSDKHQLRVTASTTKLGTINLANENKELGQVSFQAFDEWQVKDGVILVLGMDYSRFVGAGNESALSPRLGMQFDVDAKTRVKAAYTTQTEERTWSDAIELEDNAVLFRDQFTAPTFTVENEKVRMNRSRRLEFGIERVLDNNSSVEALGFFDSVAGRGVGLTNLPLDFLDADESGFTANQTGKARGVRVVYTRRFNSIFSASAGYSFGNGQKLSSQGATNPAEVFDNGNYQNFVGQLNADLKTGTQIKTIYRLSPQATVFAIDPFQGRMAIYDPGLSVLVTQSLPTLGLPIRAEAIVDARNIFDSQTMANSEEGNLRLNSQRRLLRGGILVRF